MTKAEVLLWLKLKNSQLGYKFRRQHGISKFIVDFYCPELKLAIELDGGIHGVKEVALNDLEKERTLNNLGIMVKRYYNDQVLDNIGAVLDDLKTFCDNLKNN